MGLLDRLDPEEQVGRAWHRLVGHRGSYPRYPDAAVRLEELRVALGVVHRALGGAPGREIAAGTARATGHRLRWRERLTQGEERLERPVRSAERLTLPPCLMAFPERALNRRLYVWLAGWFAALPEELPPSPADPLQADLQALARARRVAAEVERLAPGLARDHRVLADALLRMRPDRRLPTVEAAVESVVRALLGAPAPVEGLAGDLFHAIHGDDDACLGAFTAPRGYRPFLPVPLWGEVAAEGADAGHRDTAADADDSRAPHPDDSEAADERRRQARREDNDQAERRDSLILYNKAEFLLAWAEMLNLNRAVDDSDPEQARQAADDLDELSLNRTRHQPASRLKLGLDLRPGETDTTPLRAEITYPEWDWKRGAYHRDHCRVRVVEAAVEGERWQPDDEARRHIRKVRRQFEALRGRREVLRAQLDGSDLDTDAVVRSRCDLIARGRGDERIYCAVRDGRRDLAVVILVDASQSTDGWVRNRRVMDVQKEALTALALGLDACGDRAAILAFASRTRCDVRLTRLKDFDAAADGRTLCRIAALRPGAYTRMGAALRHACTLLDERPERHRLILLLSDGKPNDLDHYEGRYGVEDTRKAVHEARRAGHKVFAVTVDRRAEDYVPYLFGRGGYAMINHIERLAPALPAIYRHLVA